MNIKSDFSKDVRSGFHQSGGYEWWYFDAVSVDGKYSFTVIFYEGNPFSTRYIDQLEDSNPMPENFPAISVSIYEDGTPIYYSFTEFDRSDCLFSEERPLVKVGPHKMKGKATGDGLKYSLELREILPSGDQLEAFLEFESPASDKGLLSNQSENLSAGHEWNLVQPWAKVRGNIQISSRNEAAKEIKFKGHGYHDHNVGQEPMHNEFTDWYWGRFHFDYATLVYYVMNRKNSEQHQAWLISNENSRILDTFDEITLKDKSLSVFWLSTARKIIFNSAKAEAQIQQRVLLDNGPFYQRFQSDIFLNIPDENRIENVTGISEYIRPKRIYSRLFWPLINMRVRYAAESPHWVQKSKRLYRWVW